MLLTICLLNLLATGAFCCMGGAGKRDGNNCKYWPYDMPDTETKAPSCCPEEDSPSGGPRSNPSAAICYFRRNSNTSRKPQIQCYRGKRSAVCSAVATSETRDYASKGPTPVGEYLIGQIRGNDGVEWFNLYPKMKNNCGYHDYNHKTETGRRHFGLHPGRVSEGGVTVDTSDSCNGGNYLCYNTHLCWKRIKSLLKEGSMTYRVKPSSGILYVTD